MAHQDNKLMILALFPPHAQSLLVQVQGFHNPCRYLDMIVTEGVRDTFRKRSKVMSTIRHMLEQQDFLEVETPVLESTAGQLVDKQNYFSPMSTGLSLLSIEPV